MVPGAWPLGSVLLFIFSQLAFLKLNLLLKETCLGFTAAFTKNVIGRYWVLRFHDYCCLMADPIAYKDIVRVVSLRHLPLLKDAGCLESCISFRPIPSGQCSCISPFVPVSAYPQLNLWQLKSPITNFNGWEWKLLIFSKAKAATGDL